MRKVSDCESSWYDDHQVSYMPDLDSPRQNSQSNNTVFHQPPYPCKKELDHLPYHVIHPHEHFLQIPLLESPKLLHQSAAATLSSNNCLAALGIDINQATTVQSSSISQEERNFHTVYTKSFNEQAVDQVTDWRVLDKFVASQLSQDDHHVSKENSYPNEANNKNIFQATGNTTALLVRHLEKQEMVLEKSSLSTSAGCQIG